VHTGSLDQCAKFVMEFSPCNAARGVSCKCLLVVLHPQSRQLIFSAMSQRNMRFFIQRTASKS
jgi:hypothetical protein